MPERVRLQLWFAFLRRYAECLGVDFKSLLWCLRREKGEISGRRHFHYLLGGLPKFCVNKRGCFSQMALWDREKSGLRHCGHARVYLYDDKLNGVEYVTKCLNGDDRAGASSYEAGKFGWVSSELTLGNSLMEHLGATKPEKDRARLWGANTRQGIRDAGVDAPGRKVPS